MDIITHYDNLINDNNDPFRDPQPLREYMDKWDGQLFIDSMQLTSTKKSEYVFGETFDIIYSSLSMMHFENKRHFIFKISELLNKNGTFCLSIDKKSNDTIDMGNYKLKIYPDKIDDITEHILLANMYISNQFETEFAHILICSK